MATLLNQLSDNKGARRKSLRVGRGLGSGKGKTGGRGYKGQKSRTGVSIKGFEGGQMPIHRRLPKRGFTNTRRVEPETVNLGELQHAIDADRLDSKKAITPEVLEAAGLIRTTANGVKLLGKGELKAKISLEVTAASAGAAKALEKAGGTLKILEAKAPAPKAEKANKAAKKPAKKAAAKTTKTPKA
ncbi:MAG: 50S ribosomal protein L15 [Hyphomicrobiales bacterium]|nr:50S ribosomal protein L15 [Hyphomicrobiales bacterium]